MVSAFFGCSWEGGGVFFLCVNMVKVGLEFFSLMCVILTLKRLDAFSAPKATSVSFLHTKRLFKATDRAWCLQILGCVFSVCVCNMFAVSFSAFRWYSQASEFRQIFDDLCTNARAMEDAIREVCTSH